MDVKSIFRPQGEDLPLLFSALNESGLLLKHMLIWSKNNHVLGRSDYHYKHEPILYGWKPGAGHKYYGGTSQTSVWEIDRPHKSEEHPTMKPVELYVKAIGNSSRSGQLALDPFLGGRTS